MLVLLVVSLAAPQLLAFHVQLEILYTKENAILLAPQIVNVKLQKNLFVQLPIMFVKLAQALPNALSLEIHQSASQANAKNALFHHTAQLLKRVFALITCVLAVIPTMIALTQLTSIYATTSNTVETVWNKAIVTNQSQSVPQEPVFPAPKILSALDLVQSKCVSKEDVQEKLQLILQDQLKSCFKLQRRHLLQLRSFLQICFLVGCFAFMRKQMFMSSGTKSQRKFLYGMSLIQNCSYLMMRIATNTFQTLFFLRLDMNQHLKLPLKRSFSKQSLDKIKALFWLKITTFTIMSTKRTF